MRRLSYFEFDGLGSALSFEQTAVKEQRLWWRLKQHQRPLRCLCRRSQPFDNDWRGEGDSPPGLLRDNRQSLRLSSPWEKTVRSSLEHRNAASWDRGRRAS